jgi:hypothetical protein
MTPGAIIAISAWALTFIVMVWLFITAPDEKDLWPDDDPPGGRHQP